MYHHKIDSPEGNLTQQNLLNHFGTVMRKHDIVTHNL